MYDFADIQVLFDSSSAVLKIAELLQQTQLSYKKESSHYVLDMGWILVPLRNRIILLSELSSPQVFNITSDEHINKLMELLRSQVSK